MRSAWALHDTARQWLAEGQPAVVVDVVASRGSVPREAGTRMLVCAHTAAGTIGGGHLEWQAVADARRLLAGDDTVKTTQRIALGPSLGQCCGGAVELRLARLDAHHLHDWPWPAPRFHLQLYGAGHVGAAVVRLLADLPCRVVWLDEREPSAADHMLWPSHIERRCTEPLVAEVDNAPPGSAHLVMTHSHALDLDIVQAVLRQGHFGWLGLIGSQTKRARFEHRLRERGFDDALLARLVCPVGLPGIGGKEPEVVALAVVAQLMGLTGPQTSPSPALAQAPAPLR